MKIFGREISFSRVENKDVKASDNNRPYKKIKNERQIYPERQDIGKWRASVTSAESIDNPNRYNLLKLYKDVDIDAHVTSLVNTRKNMILGSDFIVTKDDVEDEEKTALINKKWFNDFNKLALDAKMWGYSLIQFGDIIEDEFTDIELIPRQYVKPEFSIVTENPSGYVGENYTELPYSDWCIGVGEKRDLGIYAKVAPLYLWKKGALGAWAEFSDKFGSPIRIGKTDLNDKKTRDNMELMLRNMGQSAWGLFNTDDEMQLLEAEKTDAFEVFNQLIERCNSEISKLILGQTGTADTKAFVGSAQVHERIAQMYEKADEVDLASIHNYQLIPLLNKHGFGFEGYKIQRKSDDGLKIDQQIRVDDMLLKYYHLSEEEILERYDRTVEKKEVKESDMKEVKNKLDDYYS